MSIQLVERSTSIAGRAMLLAALLAAASLTQAQTEQAPANEAHRILDEAVKKTAAMPAWTSDIEMKMSMMGLFEMVMTGATTNKDKLSRMNLKGKLDLGDPTMIMEMGMAMIVDKARTMWIEMEMNVGEMPQKMVMKGDVAKLTALSGEATALNAATPLGGDFNALQQINPETVAQYKKSFDLTAKGEQELDGAAVYVIEARMKKDARDRANAASGGALTQLEAQGLSMGDSRMMIDKQTGFMRRMEQMDASGAPAMSLTYKNIKPATEVSDALFEYKPGPDVEVIDLMDALNDALPTPTPPPARRR